MAKNAVLPTKVLEDFMDAAVKLQDHVGQVMVASVRAPECPDCAARKEKERARKERYRLGL